MWPNEGAFRHLPGRTEQTHENGIAGVPGEIEAEYKYGVILQNQLLRCGSVEGVESTLW